MTKITLLDPQNLQNESTVVTQLTQNNDVLETFSDTVLSRDGTAPNQMLSNLDMNHYRVLNLSTPISTNEPLRLQDLANFNDLGVINALPAGGTTGQTLVKTSNSDYVVSWATTGISIPLFLAPTALTNTQGLVITQSTPNGGSVVGPINLNSITVIDGTQAVTGGFPFDSFGQITNQTDALRINYRVTGGSANHFGLNVVTDVTGTNGGVAGIVSSIGTDVATITGDWWGNISFVRVGPTGNLNQSAICYEAEPLIATGGAVLNRIGFSANSQGPVAASGIDAAFCVNVANFNPSPYNGGAPWKDGIFFSNALYGASTFPIATTGNIMRGDTGTVANVLEFPNLTVTGKILDFPNVQMLGTGRLNLSNVVNAAAFSVTANAGTTTPTLQVDTSNGSGNGVYLFSTAAGSGANILTISTATNEGLNINAKGSGAITLGNTSTGGVGIVNTSAKTKLDVNANASSSPALTVATSIARLQAADAVSGGFEMATYGAGSSAGNIIAGFTAGGTAASPTGTANSAYMFNMRGYGYNSGAQLGGLWIIMASEAWSAGHQGTQHQWYTTPNASTTIAQAMQLNASGGLSIGTTADGGIGSLLTNTSIKSQGATAGIGYATGAGGTVTQATGRTTGVTLNKVSGAIILFSQVNTAVSAATAQSFILTNSAIAATDVVHVTQQTGTDLYEIFVTNTAAGSCKITNYSTGGATNEAPVFNFVVIKGVTS